MLILTIFLILGNFLFFGHRLYVPVIPIGTIGALEASASLTTPVLPFSIWLYFDLPPSGKIPIICPFLMYFLASFIHDLSPFSLSIGMASNNLLCATLLKKCLNNSIFAK